MIRLLLHSEDVDLAALLAPTLLAESHLTRRLFGSIVRRIAALPLPTG
jgi:hypothetical protein